MTPHSTNYTNTLIHPSQDCRAKAAMMPPKPDSIAGIQYQMLAGAPYALNSDDLLCAVTATRKVIPNDTNLRKDLFSKGQPCLRASPLLKTYGWAVHHNATSKIALVDPQSDKFRTLEADPAISQIYAMRNARK